MAIISVLLFKRRHDAAIAELERAFALNPNFVDFRYAQALMYSGEPARAIEVLEASTHLDPLQPSMFAFSGVMGGANYMLRRYGEAVRWYRESASRLRSRDDWRRRGRKPSRSCGSTPVSQSKAGNVLPSTRAPRTSSTILMGCAR